MLSLVSVIGSFLHGYVPEIFFEQYMSDNPWFAVPLSVVLAVPMYANAVGIVPVVEGVCCQRCVPIGTALAFMMAGSWVVFTRGCFVEKSDDLESWWEFFFATVASLIIVLGYLYNFVL